MRSMRDRIKIGANLEIGLSGFFRHFLGIRGTPGTPRLHTFLSARHYITTSLLLFNAVVAVTRSEPAIPGRASIDTFVATTDREDKNVAVVVESR
jgi:hypothetical protein